MKLKQIVKQTKNELTTAFSIDYQADNSMYSVSCWKIYDNGSCERYLYFPVGIDKSVALFQLQRLVDLVHLANRSPYEAAVSIGAKQITLLDNNKQEKQEEE